MNEKLRDDFAKEIVNEGNDIMSLNKIRLELARTADFPQDSRRHGYEFVAPLNEDAHIDP